ncbi:MAG: T9SS type A sorting domain-containing protein [Flavobacteriales bacterium]|nr:T9SS type A sorting domain-containing protein [Flavobacteriales bacterium]
MRARDLVVQPDGKVVLAGYESSGFGRDGVLVRLRTDGVPDSTFNGDGILVLASYTDLDQLDAVDLLDDGAIVGGGYTEINSDDRALLVKLTPSGFLDNTFDGDGLLTPTFSTTSSRIYGVEGAGQQVVAAGALIINSTSADLFILRRNANGTADTGFGLNGVAEIDVLDDDWLDDLELLPDGRLAITGYTGSTAPGGDIDFLLACYTADGDPDLGFGTNGIVITETSPFYEGGYGICTMPDGKLVVAGFGGALGNSSMVVLRYANDLSTALEGASATLSMSIYPNPTVGLIHVEGITANAQVTFTDARGRVVVPARMAKGLFDMSGMDDGMYLVRVSDGAHNGAGRVVVLR